MKDNNYAVINDSGVNVGAYNAQQDERSFITSMFLYILGIILFLSFLGLLIFVVVQSSLFSKEVNEILADIERAKLVLPLLQLLSEKAQAGGYAPLGPDGKVPLAFLSGLNVSNFINGGCWNAFSNSPQLQSGIGINGLYFLVCVGGSTFLDGNFQWRPYDQILFNGPLGQWIRIDSSRNIIANSLPSSGTNVANFMSDTVGPLFSARTLTLSGPNTSITNDELNGIINATIEVELGGQSPAIISEDLGFGFSRPAPTFPFRFNREIKTLVASGETVLTDTPEGIEVSAGPLVNPTNVEIDNARLDVNYILGDGIPTELPVIYHAFDNVLILSTAEPIFLIPTDNSEFFFEVDLGSYIPGGFLDTIVLSTGQLSGQITGIARFTNFDPYFVTGTCEAPGFSQFIRCRGTANRTGTFIAPGQNFLQAAASLSLTVFARYN